MWGTLAPLRGHLFLSASGLASPTSLSRFQHRPTNCSPLSSNSHPTAFFSPTLRCHFHSAFHLTGCTIWVSAVNQWHLPLVLVLATATGRPGAQPGAQPGVVLESVGALREPTVTAMFPWVVSVPAIRQPVLRLSPLAAAAAPEAGDRLEHPHGSLRMSETTRRSRTALLET